MKILQHEIYGMYEYVTCSTEKCFFVLQVQESWTMTWEWNEITYEYFTIKLVHIATRSELFGGRQV